jgi:hypothetical protein
MQWLFQWSVAIGGMTSACGLVELVRAVERYQVVGRVAWSSVFRALIVPILTFCIVRFAERQAATEYRAEEAARPSDGGR